MSTSIDRVWRNFARPVVLPNPRLYLFDPVTEVNIA
jgi:hypothetical protein